MSAPSVSSSAFDDEFVAAKKSAPLKRVETDEPFEVKNRFDTLPSESHDDDRSLWEKFEKTKTSLSDAVIVDEKESKEQKKEDAADSWEHLADQ